MSPHPDYDNLFITYLCLYPRQNLLEYYNHCPNATIIKIASGTKSEISDKKLYQ
jgi:hypothetical protein